MSRRPVRVVKSADLAELRAAADRLAEALSDADEEEVVSEFKQMRRRGKAPLVEMIFVDANILDTPPVIFIR
jgi:hypothetical protein